ncbi:MAG TPA: response regulator [Pyrinomonadaceae bacterium]|jgi:DNA-binding NtrC family response regulator
MAAILIVDDDDAVRDVLYDLFSEQHLCHAAATAEQALGFLRDQTYDTVLTDISMPGLSGVELLSILRREQPDTPVIVVSGIGDRTHAEGLTRLGAFDFILKPFRLESVEQSVSRALEHSRGLKERGRAGSPGND